MLTKITLSDLYQVKLYEFAPTAFRLQIAKLFSISNERLSQNRYIHIVCHIVWIRTNWAQVLKNVLLTCFKSHHIAWKLIVNKNSFEWLLPIHIAYICANWVQVLSQIMRWKSHKLSSGLKSHFLKSHC